MFRLNLHKTLGILLISLSMFSFAQDKAISLSYKNTTIRQVLNDIEKQSGLIFSYNSRLFDDTETITIQLKGVSVDSSIQFLFRNNCKFVFS